MKHLGNYLYIVDGLVHAVVHRKKYAHIKDFGRTKPLVVTATACGSHAFEKLLNNGMTKQTARASNCLKCVFQLGRLLRDDLSTG